MRTWLEIDKNALLHNLRQFLALIGSEKKFLAVVKANAYGHGLKEVSQIINSVILSLPKANEESPADAGDLAYARDPSQPVVAQDDREKVWFGVDSIDEAIILRQQGIRALILTLGYVPMDRLQEAIANDVRLTVYNKETIEAIGKFLIFNFKFSNQIPNSKFLIHLKVETGTSRQGILEEEIPDFVSLIQKYPQIEIEGISTHFANIEDTTDPTFAQGQLSVFKRVLERLKALGIDPPIKHTACSAATILFPETYFNLVRVGLSLYGLWPSKETFVSAQKMSLRGSEATEAIPSSLELHPVLAWKSIIAQIKKIKAGTPVSYGLTERVSRDSKIAIVPVGYYDGYDRKLSSVGNVLIYGQRCKVLGRVCMNMMVVDVTDVAEAKLEDEVVLLGSQGTERINAEELAQKIGTINYEVVTRINPLLPRVIK